MFSEVAKSAQKVCNGNFRGTSKPQTKPSLRHWQEGEDLAYSTSELITPEFRHHVAKKLSKFLDSNYVCSEDVGLIQNGNLSCPHKCSGIKLLLTSKQSLLHVAESRQQFPGRGINTKNKMNCSSSSESETDEEELSRLTEAAVSAHSIIQKVSNESKEEVKRETNRLKRKKEKKKKKKREQSYDDEEEVQKKKKHKKHKEKHKT